LKKALEESEEERRKEAAMEKKIKEEEREKKREADERDKQWIADKKADRNKLAKERLKLGKSQWKANDPAKTATSFVPSQEALNRAKAAAEKIPKKTRGAVAKTPKKTKEVTTRADEAMYMSAVNHHQKQAAEASAKGGNAG